MSVKSKFFALCVREPIDTLLTFVFDIFLTFFKLTLPEYSVSYLLAQSLWHFLSFIGFTDVRFISADKHIMDSQSLANANSAVDPLIKKL
jgi:hypothetical protein|tara:strand:+ start:91 stop:360 length:270 start_codon:yes stop_codon:yes gene_type:complete